MPPVRSQVGQLLAELELISHAQLRHAEAEASRTGEYLVPTLVRLDYIGGAALAGLLARHYRAPRIELAAITIEGDVRAAVALALCRELRALPVRVRGSVMLVAMDDPSDVRALAELRAVTGRHPVPVVATSAMLDAALRVSDELQGH